jgi:hypothetical protein
MHVLEVSKLVVQNKQIFSYKNNTSYHKAGIRLPACLPARATATGYHKAFSVSSSFIPILHLNNKNNNLIFKLCSTTEQMPALVFINISVRPP